MRAATKKSRIISCWVNSRRSGILHIMGKYKYVASDSPGEAKELLAM